MVVAGAGIGGLAASLELARAGHAVTILEQGEAVTGLGAGIQLSPNGTRVLRELGVLGAVERLAVRPERLRFRHWRSGAVAVDEPLGDAVEARFGAPYLHVHRADLVAELLAAARAAGVDVRTGSPVKGFRDDGASVVALDADGDALAEGALLVGADGIHSRVRAGLFGAEAARFTGNVAWRALVPTAALPEPLRAPQATVWWGPGAHFVHYPVRGGTLMNCVCVVEQSDWQRESWTDPGDPADVARAFEGWHDDVGQLVAAMTPDACHRWALFDRRPLPAWSRGRVTLLGDACHPTLPFLAQGGVMAIEDAALLRRALAEVDGVAAALARYGATRRPPTAAVQRASRRNARVFHLGGPVAWARDRLAPWMGSRTMARIYAQDVLRIPLRRA